MASIFAHGAVALAFGYSLNGTKSKFPFVLVIWGIICSIIPDLDILTFYYGIPYESMYGHRGITHSILFALVIAAISMIACLRVQMNHLIGFIYIFLCTVSHGILDAMTTGGRGVAFFAPFSEERFFLPWRFIKVSPLGIRNFFSDWGKAVIINELTYILIPCALLCLIIYLIRKSI